MKVTVTLNVSSDQYFDFIVTNIIKELPKSIRSKTKPKDIQKGFKYEQTYQLKKGSFVSHKEIEEFEYGKFYKLKMLIPYGAQIISHSVKDIDKNTIEVQYEEVMKTKRIGAKIMYSIRLSANKKQMAQRLQAIATVINGKVDK